MTVGMWFTDDLANILRSLALSNVVPGIPQDERYQAGFQSALLLVAVALGIPADQARDLVETHHRTLFTAGRDRSPY